jgi:hypothetical protein
LVMEPMILQMGLTNQLSKGRKISEGKRTVIGQKVQVTGMNIQVAQSMAVVHQKKEQQIL